MQIAAAVTKAVFTFLVKVGVPKAIAAGVATWGVKIALTVALSSVMRAMQPKPRGMDQGTELQTKLDPAYPREVAVGQFATGGSLAYINSEGTNNANLWMVIALSDDKIEQITQVRGNGAALTFSGDLHTGLRACTSHFQTASGGDCLYVRIYKGDESQAADADLVAAFPSDLDSNFRGRGIAYAIVKMIWDADAFANGTPELVFVGEGAHCLDPRSDTTAYTANAALIAGQFLRGFTNNGIRVVGLGCSADDLPETELGDAADDCDDAISLAAGGTEARYRAGGMISARETPREVLSHLMAAMAGEHIDRGGEIVLLPGVARTPTLDIAETDLLSDEGIAFAARRTADERINAITSTFVNPADGWQEASLPPRKDTSAITADGDRFETSRAYRFVFSKTQGQRLDEIVLRSARKEGFLSVPAPLWAFELAPGDWSTMTNQRWGGSEKTWKVESVNLAITNGAVGGAPAARCSLTLRETASSVYTWSTADEITLSAGAVGPPIALAAHVDADDRIITVDALPVNAPAGVSALRIPGAPLSSNAASAIQIAEHDYFAVGRTYELPSGEITGLSTDTAYAVFWDLIDEDYVATVAPADFYTDASRYIAIGVQRTQDGGGGFSPPPPPPPGYGGGGGGGSEGESWDPP